MSRIEKKLKLSDEKFKRRIGTAKPVFHTMLGILQTAHAQLHNQGGKLPDLTPSDKLLITLKYYREYTTKETADYQTTLLTFENHVFKPVGVYSKSEILKETQNILGLFAQTHDEKTIVSKITKHPPLNNFFVVSQGLIPYDKYRGHDEQTIKNRIWHSHYPKDATYEKNSKAATYSDIHFLGTVLFGSVTAIGWLPHVPKSSLRLREYLFVKSRQIYYSVPIPKRNTTIHLRSSTLSTNKTFYT